ncbi:MAG TPA: hypothetical protein VHT29_08630 [Solirubrobacteraceae bacterium]|nr:hypothetical protein [Solirubrobacteraceae bacterium]
MPKESDVRPEKRPSRISSELKWNFGATVGAPPLHPASNAATSCSTFVPSADTWKLIGHPGPTTPS